MHFVSGVGWMGTTGWGRLRAGKTELWSTGEMETALAQAPGGREIRNYGRFTRHTRLILHALALALQDAGLPGPPDCGPRGGGLIGSGELGTQTANLEYFRDFCANGRVMARGNLFLYTLPTSPLAEAALTYQLRGPLFWLSTASPAGALDRALSAAADILAGGGASTMFVCHGQPDRVVLYAVSGASAGGWPLSSVMDAARAAQASGVYPERLMVQQGTNA